MNKLPRFDIRVLLFILFGVFLLSDFWLQKTMTPPISYSEFQKLLKESKVSEIVISDSYIHGTLKDAVTENKRKFVTARVEPEFARELEPYGVRVSRAVESTWLRSLFSWLLPVMLFLAIWTYFGRRFAAKGGLGSGLLSIGKSKAKIYVETDTKVTFEHVAGVDEAKEELKEIVDFLRNPKGYGRLGGRMPKGVLLVGPPGTGKTLLAKAVAGEASVPFFSISGSEFVEMFVGVGAARVRDLFEQARTKAPCIIFIDELDALGRARTGYASGGHDEKEQTLNQLLVEMDGFDSSSGVILLAATNRPEVLDPALLRAGRFDRQVLVDRPDRRERVAILKVHLRTITLASNVDIDEIAAMTPGFTGADLANLVNEAALMATRGRADKVDLPDFTAAMERIIAGLEKKNRLLNPMEKKIIAYHEMGHALVAAAIPGSDTVHKVSIIPRGVGALGYTMQRPIEDRFLMTRTELENKMAVLMGGRAAERIVFDHLSTGAADDIYKATEIARSMVVKYGMDTNLGSVTYDNDPATYLGTVLPGVQNRRYSEETAHAIDSAVKQIIETSSGMAQEILRTNLRLLEESAELLLAKETLTQVDLSEVFQRIKAPTLKVAV